MLFTTNPHITGAATDPLSELSESLDMSVSTLDPSSLDINPVSSHMSISAEEMMNHVIGPINQSENSVHAAAAVAMADPLNPTASVELQRAFVDYTINLTIASRVAKFASEFVNQTTKIQ